MKRKFFLSFGAVALAVGGFLAAKASSKFAGAANLYYLNGSGCQHVATTAGSALITSTTLPTSDALKFLTSGGSTSYQIYATTGCQKLAYFKPL